MAERAAQTPVEALAEKCEGGTLLLADILAQLARPGRDPREDLPPPIFKKGVIKLDDLSPGMELSGTVLNVVDFGAFVDIGLHDTGLVHISQLANKYVRDPHEVVSVGDTVKVWVHEIDKTRRRVSLTMIAPGTPRGGERRGQTAARATNRPNHPARQCSRGWHPRGARPENPRRNMPVASGAGRRASDRAVALRAAAIRRALGRATLALRVRNSRAARQRSPSRSYRSPKP